MPYLLDTGPFTFALTGSPRLSDEMRARLEGERLLISAISFYGIAQKVRLGKWDDMAPYVDDLDDIALQDGFEIIPLSASLALKAATLDWSHRDPFDRMIASTALVEGLVLVSSDNAFDALPIERIW